MPAPQSVDFMTREGEPCQCIADQLSEIAGKCDTEFVIRSITEKGRRKLVSFFSIDGSGGTRRIESRKKRLEIALERAGLLTDRGFKFERQALKKIIAVDLYWPISFKKAFDEGRLRGVGEYSAHGDKSRIFHTSNSFDYILVEGDQDFNMTFTVVAERLPELSMLVSYVSGVLVRHFPTCVKSTTIVDDTDLSDILLDRGYPLLNESK